MKVSLITDAWAPQVNGVVYTLSHTRDEMIRMGHEVQVIEPSQFLSMPVPFEHGLRLGAASAGAVGRQLVRFAPQAVHIATEGPLGWAARRACQQLGFRYTTAWHTNFPAYLETRYGVPERWSWPALRRFHQDSLTVMAPTNGIADELRAHGIGAVKVWGRGVDAHQFSPGRSWRFAGLPRPIFLSVGRVANEKNLEAFLSLDLPGSKVVVGGGPALARLSRQFPQAHFAGRVDHQELASVYRAADVFVFPSQTDTFGLVMLEAMACGVPVAALPHAAPNEVVANGVAGVVDADLRKACLEALQLDAMAVREHAGNFAWQKATERFVSLLAVPAIKLREQLRPASPASHGAASGSVNNPVSAYQASCLSSRASSWPARPSAFSSSSSASARTD
mgnify:CR=1 FL=1